MTKTVCLELTMKRWGTAPWLVVVGLLAGCGRVESGPSDGAIDTTFDAKGDDAASPHTWVPTTSLPSGRYDHAAVTYNGYLYVLGGFGGRGYLDEVLVTPILPNGLLGDWSTTTPFPIHRIALASVVANGYLYVLGGANDTIRETADVSYAPILTNGAVGAWQPTTPLPSPRETFSAVVYNNNVYVVAGNYSAGGVNWQDVQMATINGNGSLSSWKTLTPLPGTRTGHTSIAAKVGGIDYLYVMGGAGTGAPPNDDVLRARILTDGTIGAWEVLSPPLPTPRVDHASVVLDDRVFVMGGDTSGTALGDMYGTPLASQDPWDPGPPSAPLPSPRLAHASVAANGTIYLIGGNDHTTTFDGVYCLMVSPVLRFTRAGEDRRRPVRGEDPYGVSLKERLNRRWLRW